MSAHNAHRFMEAEACCFLGNIQYEVIRRNLGNGSDVIC